MSEPVNEPVANLILSSLSSHPIKMLSLDPLSIIIPASPDGLPEVPVASSINLSEIVELVVSIVFVAP